MGGGMCSRRQKSLLQTASCLLALACLGSGAFLYGHLQAKASAAQALAAKFRQQQEALSAQLQVVYEHRSRLERSLQKERGEHKKTKEDFLVYKLEAQEALNKEKQDSMNRYGALSSQHKILKNQHEEVKKQLMDLQLQHNGLKLEHRKITEAHNQKYVLLQREKEGEISALQDTVYKLREESKLLRKAHQDIHTQLVSAQAQMEEFRQLKETLQKMPSFKEAGAGRGPPRPPAQGQFPGPGSVVLQAARPKVPMDDAQAPRPPQDRLPPPARSPPDTDNPALRDQGGGNRIDIPAQQGDGGLRPTGHAPVGQLAPLEGARQPPASAWPQAAQRASPVARFSRMVNSLPKAEQDSTAATSLRGLKEGAPRSEALAPGFQLPLDTQPLQEQTPGGGRTDSAPERWQDVVNRVDAQMDEGPPPPHAHHLAPGARPVPAMADGEQALAGQRRVDQPPPAAWADTKGDMDELQMDAGMIERDEDSSRAQREAVIQQAVAPEKASDPAQDPNNQGEDEFEEAELERPEFEEKAGPAEEREQTSRAARGLPRGKVPKEAVAAAKKRADYLTDDYQEDEELDLEDHQGDADDRDATELAHEPGNHAGRDQKKEDYY